jgi:collagen type I alpha
MRPSSFAPLLAAALLAGCGGGGGTAASPSPNAPSSGGVAALSTQDAAQSATDSAFDPIDTGEADAVVQNGSVGTSSARRSPQALGHGCRNRTTRKITVNADNSVTVETIRYYDDACTQAERDAVATGSVSGGVLTIVRTVTTFNQAALQLGVRKSTYTFTGATDSGSWTVVSAFYPGTSSTPITQYAHAASISGSTYDASTGRIANDAKPSINTSYGHQSATTATVATDASGDVTFTGARNGESFKAALGGLSISAAPPFTIAGGTQIGASSLTGSVTFDGDGNLTAVSLTGTLPGGNTLVVSSSTAANGAVTVNGTITSASGANVATFTTDASGNGILTLANGTQVPIVDWHVVW